MKCPRCGAPTKPGAGFCTGCGGALTNPAQPMASAIQPPRKRPKMLLIVLVLVVVAVLLVGAAAMALTGGNKGNGGNNDGDGTVSTSNDMLKIEGPSTSWSGDYAQFNATTNPSFTTGKVIYDWDFGDGYQMTFQPSTLTSEDGYENHQSHKFPLSGTYNVSVTITDYNDQNHQENASLQITIKDPERVVINSAERVGTTYYVNITVTNISPKEQMSDGIYFLYYPNTNGSFYNSPRYHYQGFDVDYPPIYDWFIKPGWTFTWVVYFDNVPVDQEPQFFIYGYTTHEVEVDFPGYEPTPAPPTVNPPAPDPSKAEPVVFTRLSTSYPFSPGYGAHPSPVYGDPTAGLLYTGVEGRADAAHIGIMVYFTGLTNHEVYVNATTSSGEPQWINLYNDGSNGCYGMLMDDPSAVSGDMAWTWMYGGSGTAEYHNISITVTIYKLGSFQLRTYAYDQDTGQLVSDTQSYDLTVYGSGGKYYTGVQMFDNSLGGGTYSFVPGEKYDFYLTDTSRSARYEGLVRSVLTLPYVQNIWMVGNDGSMTLLEKGSDGYYSWTWYHSAGISSHTTHLIIQLGETGGGPYPYSSGDYYTVDDRTGLLMSSINGMSHPGLQIYLQSL